MHDSPATKPKVETDQYDSPCSLPKPNQNVFHSVGKLTKKHDSLHERLSLPLHLTTPNTPKSNRSRFVLPSSLSPFPLSPKNITSPTLNNAKPLSASYHAVSTPLKIGFSSEHLNNFEPETLSKSSRSPSRSQWERPGSPNVVSSSLVRESDILELSSSFGYEDDSSDDGMEIEDDTDIGAYDISPEMLRPVLWRNPVVNFLTREYFEGIETGPTLNRPCFDPEGLVDYFSCRFEIIESFGDGSFSNVFKVFDRIDGKIYAVKRSKKPFSGTIDRERRLHEIQNLFLVRGCFHCIRLEEAWEQNGYLYIQTEMCENGSLKDVIDYMALSDSKFTEHQIWNILRQLAIGLCDIHAAQIAHLDLKPANVFIDAHGILKIGDFGLSTRNGFQHDADSEGDKVYMAPEVLEGSFGFAADVFSLGLVALELAADIVLPGEGPSWTALRIFDLHEIVFEDISDNLISLIKDMLRPSPDQRPQANALLQRISNHLASLTNKSTTIT